MNKFVRIITALLGLFVLWSVIYVTPFSIHNCLRAHEVSQAITQNCPEGVSEIEIYNLRLIRGEERAEESSSLFGKAFYDYSAVHRYDARSATELIDASSFTQRLTDSDQLVSMDAFACAFQRKSSIGEEEVILTGIGGLDAKDLVIPITENGNCHLVIGGRVVSVEKDKLIEAVVNMAATAQDSFWGRISSMRSLFG